jgi:deoxycytidylate deaminase
MDFALVGLTGSTVERAFSMTKTKGYELARKASLNSDYSKQSLGAGAIYGNKVLAYGWNSNKTSSIQAKYNSARGFDGYIYKSSVHAEMMVVSKIKHLDIDFSSVKIFVWRGTNSPLLSKPCAACEKAMRDLGIRRIYYTGNNSYIEEYYN